MKFLNVNSLKESKQQSIVVLGEGSDWESRHEIDIASLMKAGQWIIILRPREGSPFPLIRNEKEESELTFGKWSGSNWFPDRLDREFWSTTEEDSFGFDLCSRPKQILLTASKGPQVWQYATYKAREGGGCLFVGVPIVAHWNRSPVPRELLAHLVTRCIPLQTKVSQNN